MGSKFKKGDMVVCLETPTMNNGWKRRPVVNGVYTVRQVVWEDEGPGLLFEEIVNPIVQYQSGFSGEPLWHPCRYRKIKTPDIGALREIVTKAMDGAKRKKKVKPTKRAKAPAQEGV